MSDQAQEDVKFNFLLISDSNADPEDYIGRDVVVTGEDDTRNINNVYAPPAFAATRLIADADRRIHCEDFVFSDCGEDVTLLLGAIREAATEMEDKIVGLILDTCEPSLFAHFHMLASALDIVVVYGPPNHLTSMPIYRTQEEALSGFEEALGIDGEMSGVLSELAGMLN